MTDNAGKKISLNTRRCDAKKQMRFSSSRLMKHARLMRDTEVILMPRSSQITNQLLYTTKCQKEVL